ncbi:MAG: DUF3568 family protein [Candidatus Rokubacteria bacterium]|nr:DUF3568 family protein [Candidatus Rokubacteria bacterium]
MIPHWRILLGGLVLAASSLSGCAAAGLTLFGVGAGVAAGTGTAYTFDGIAYRTFTAPLDDVRGAMAVSLQRMDIVVTRDEATADGRSIVGSAGDRTIGVELRHLTPRTTQIRVTAKYSLVLRDRATAGEIIAQTETALDERPQAAQRREN